MQNIFFHKITFHTVVISKTRVAIHVSCSNVIFVINIFPHLNSMTIMTIPLIFCTANVFLSMVYYGFSTKNTGPPYRDFVIVGATGLCRKKISNNNYLDFSNRHSLQQSPCLLFECSYNYGAKSLHNVHNHLIHLMLLICLEKKKQ